VVWSRVAAQPGTVSWACTLHHPMAGVLVPRTTIQGVRTHNLVSRLKSCVHVLLRSASEQTYVITFPYKWGPSSISTKMNHAAPVRITLEAGSGQPHRWRRPPLHQQIASGSNHLCTSSDNDHHSEWFASSNVHLRVCAVARRSSPPSSYGG
jgi:hypothetical protein